MEILKITLTYIHGNSNDHFDLYQLLEIEDYKNVVHHI